MTGFFHNRICQKLFSWIHPDLSTSLALRWSQHSRLTGKDMPDYMGEDKEHQVIFAKQYLKEHKPEEAPDYFIFGHRHIMLDLMLSRQTRMMIIGDWIKNFSYAIMRDGQLSLEQFEVDESMYEVEERTGVSIAF